MKICEDLSEIKNVTVGDGHVCIACVKTGARWLYLRTCGTCGGTPCCDSSPNKRATAHWKASGHAVVASAEAGERWLWGYDHEQAREY